MLSILLKYELQKVIFIGLKSGAKLCKIYLLFSICWNYPKIESRYLTRVEETHKNIADLSNYGDVIVEQNGKIYELNFL